MRTDREGKVKTVYLNFHSPFDPLSQVLLMIKIRRYGPPEKTGIWIKCSSFGRIFKAGMGQAELAEG